MLNPEIAEIVDPLATPLAPAIRPEFLAAVEQALAGREVGPGLAHRIAVALQRQFFEPLTRIAAAQVHGTARMTRQRKAEPYSHGSRGPATL